MLYIWFKDLNPLFPTLILGPVVSILVALITYKLVSPRKQGMDT